MEADTREKKVRKTLIIEPSLWQQIQARAVKERVSTSWLLRSWSREKLRRTVRDVS